MTKLWLIFASLAFSNLFLIYNPTGEFTYPMSGVVSPLNSVVYFAYEHVGMIILASLIVWPPTEHKYMYKLFLLITCLDMFFFLLYYKSPIVWNPLKCAIYAIPLLYEQWKYLHLRYLK